MYAGSGDGTRVLEAFDGMTEITLSGRHHRVQYSVVIRYAVQFGSKMLCFSLGRRCFGLEVSCDSLSVSASPRSQFRNVDALVQTGMTCGMCRSQVKIMLISHGETLLEMAAKGGNVSRWKSVANALREDLGAEQVQNIPGQCH